MNAPAANRKRRWRQQWSGAAAFVPWLLLALGVVLVAAQLKRPAALWDLYRPWAEIGALAMAMTAVMLTGGIDLSVGSIVALVSVTIGLLWSEYHAPIFVAAAAGVVVAALAGAVNGLLVIRGIAPLVATLATMACYAGLAMALSAGQRVAGLPPEFCRLGQGFWGGLTGQFWLLLAVTSVFALLVHHTRLGRYLYALGDNRVAATFAAVPVARVELALYTLSGCVAGLVAVFYTARGGAAIPEAGVGLELETIACVVLGGTRVTGGQGGIGRTLLGLAVMAHLDLALQLVGTRRFELPWSDAPWQLSANARQVLLGALVIAVAIWNQRAGESRD